MKRVEFPQKWVGKNGRFMWKYFSYINFGNILYILAQNDALKAALAIISCFLIIVFPVCNFKDPDTVTIVIFKTLIVDRY